MFSLMNVSDHDDCTYQIELLTIEQNILYLPVSYQKS